MPTNTATPWSIIYAIPTDEIKAFPTEVDQVKAERVAKFFGERWISTKKYSASATLKTGELAVQEKSAETFTLPAVGTVDQVIGIFSLVAETKITTSGGAFIVGGFIPASTATIKLTTNQYVELRSDGVAWLLTGGEPKRETTYVAVKTPTKAECEAGLEASASRPAQVIVEGNVEAVEVSGVVVKAGGVGISSVSFDLEPGQKWKSVAVQRWTFKLR